MKIVWFDNSDSESKTASKDQEQGGGDVIAFTSMPQVQGSGWVGGPPMRPQDVAALAERMKRGG